MESKDFIFYYYIVCGILFMVYGFVLIGGFLKMKSNDTGVPYLIVGIVEIFLGNQAGILGYLIAEMKAL